MFFVKAVYTFTCDDRNIFISVIAALYAFKLFYRNRFQGEGGCIPFSLKGLSYSIIVQDVSKI